jgi:hypothetical protein
MQAVHLQPYESASVQDPERAKLTGLTLEYLDVFLKIQASAESKYVESKRKYDQDQAGIQ